MRRTSSRVIWNSMCAVLCSGYALVVAGAHAQSEATPVYARVQGFQDPVPIGDLAVQVQNRSDGFGQMITIEFTFRDSWGRILDGGGMLSGDAPYDFRWFHMAKSASNAALPRWFNPRTNRWERPAPPFVDPAHGGWDSQYQADHAAHGGPRRTRNPGEGSDNSPYHENDLGGDYRCGDLNTVREEGRRVRFEYTPTNRPGSELGFQTFLAVVLDGRNTLLADQAAFGVLAGIQWTFRNQGNLETPNYRISNTGRVNVSEKDSAIQRALQNSGFSDWRTVHSDNLVLVPEPASVLALLTGLVGLAARRRSRACVAVLLAAAGLSLFLPTAVAQQGETRPLVSTVRVPNGDSPLGSLLYVNDAYIAYYVSEATNLVSPTQPPGRVYAQTLHTGATRVIGPDEPFRAVSVKAIEVGEDGILLTAHLTLKGAPRLGLYDGDEWRYLTVPGDALLDYWVGGNGNVYFLARPAPGATVLYVVRIDTEPEPMHTIADGEAFALSASDDGRAVALSYRLYDADYLYLALLDGDGALIQEQLLEGFPNALLDAEGGALVSDGEIHLIDAMPDYLFVQPTAFALGIGGAAVLDKRGALVVYTNDDGATIRLLNLDAQIDYPIPWWDGGVKPRRVLKGSYLLFAARDDSVRGVIPYDRNERVDLFVHDLTRLQNWGITVGAQPRNGFSNGPAIGRDDSLVAFISDSRELVAGKTTPYEDVFIQNGTSLIRVLGVGGAEPNEASFGVAVSRAGGDSRVAFASNASNLVAGDTNNALDVFLWSAANGLECVTCALDGDSFAPAVAPTGVFFLSAATNAGAPPEVDLPQAYVRFPDHSIHLFTLNGEPFDSAEAIAIAPQGLWVALTAVPRGGESQSLYLYRYEGGSFALHAVLNPPNYDLYATSVSDTGVVVFQTDAPLVAADQDERMDVYLWRGGSDGAVQLVSKHPAGGKGNDDSFGGSIDSQALRIAFTSRASNLTAVDINETEDVFVYDLNLDALYCVARDAHGLPLGGSQGVISGDGRTLAFVADSPELVKMPFANGVYVALHTIGCTPTGDTNLDGVVDDTDMLNVLFQFGEEGSLADANADGVVDDGDLLTVLFGFGVSCQAGLAGDGDGFPPNEGPEFSLYPRPNGGVVLYYHRVPTVRGFDTEAEQAADLNLAVLEDRWPYPVVGGMINLWKQNLGDPAGWSKAMLESVRLWLHGDNTLPSDFEPMVGAPFSWKWTNVYAYQPSPDTYVRFRPSASLNVRCLTARVDADGVLDMRLLGFGRDGLLQVRGHAFANGGGVGYGAEALLMGQSVWKVGQSRPPFTWSDRVLLGRITRRLFQASKNFTIYGVPCVVYIDVNGYLQATLDFAVSFPPPSAMIRFTPAAGLDATPGGGIGASISGVRVAAGVEVRFTPLLELSLPAQLSARIEEDDCCCFLVANANIRLVLRALRGSLRVGLFSNCLEGWVWCDWCRPRQRGWILGSIPGRCCDVRCHRSRKFSRRVDISFEAARWSGLTFDLATLYDQTWRKRIK